MMWKNIKNVFNNFFTIGVPKLNEQIDLRILKDNVTTDKKTLRTLR